MSLQSEILALAASASQTYYFAFDETSGTLFNEYDEAYLQGTYEGDPTLNQPPLADAGTCVDFDGVGDFATTGDNPLFNNWAQYSICVLYQSTATSAGCLTGTYQDANDHTLVERLADGKIRWTNTDGGLSEVWESTDPVDSSIRVLLTCSFNSGAMTVYANGAAVAGSKTTAQGATASGLNRRLTFAGQYQGTFESNPGNYLECLMDDSVWYGGLAMSLAQHQTLYNQIPAATIPASSLPVTLQGFFSYAEASLPMRLQSLTSVPAASLPMNLQSADPTTYQTTADRWGVQVILAGVDQSSRLVEGVTIEFKENESATAKFKIKPTAGPLDLNDYERKTVKVDFLRKDATGAVTYQVRRFTGTTTTATIDIDAGVVTIDATNDLNGQLENMSKETIAEILGGEWSPHVFREAVDGWRYARDLMSTQTKEMHIDAMGYLRTVDWAAKATPDITFTDGERFNDTLRLSRVSRRELLSEVVIGLDFRFSRLRHREIQVTFPDSLGLCSYLNQGWTLPQREMIRSAADGNSWTRISQIAFIDLPGPLANICIPPRAWAGGAEEFCLGAYWQAARRWGQSVTEQYSLTIKSVDIEAAIGRQSTTESYGITATYDTTDFEQITDYSAAPAAATFDPSTEDYVEDADGAEYDGRAAMEQAQTVILAKGKATLLGRARKNLVTFGAVYHPDLTLERTVRVQTPYLTAKGKVHAYREDLNLDRGYPLMTIDLAISRHGGSGIGVNDPLTPAAQPSTPTETPTERLYYLPYRLGGTVNAPQDSDDWDGYMTNVAPALRDPSGGVYEERFVVKMPEIEEAARTAVEVQQPATYEVAVPEDQLTLSV